MTDKPMRFRRARRTALALAGGLMPALLLAGSPGRADAATRTSLLTGQISIEAGLTGVRLTNTPGTPVLTMGLHFKDDQPDDSVSGGLEPFTTTAIVPIVGIDPTNSWYSDLCLDTQTISGSAQLGKFTRATGAIKDLQLDIVVNHSLSPGPFSSFLGNWGCPNTHLPPDAVTVVLSTAPTKGSPVDQGGPGKVTLFGTGTGSRGAGVDVTVSGVLSPVPDRSPQTCVLVPDVRDDSKSQAQQAIVAAKLTPLFNKDPGNDSYVAQQFPQPDDCVPPGSKVSMTLVAGPRP
jgi:PASTA domain